MTREITKEDIKAIDIDAIDEMVEFHSGCRGCTQQQLNGIRFCKTCCYFESDWTLEDRSNSDPPYEDVVRAAIKADEILENFVYRIVSEKNNA
jgi:hypothetical protein